MMKSYGSVYMIRKIMLCGTVSFMIMKQYLTIWVYLRDMFQKSGKGYNITIKTILNEYI